MLQYMTRGIKVVDSIKVANHLTLKCRDYLDYLGGPLVTTRSLNREEGGRRVTDSIGRKTQLATAGFEDGGGGRQPRTVGGLKKLEKAGKLILPQSCQKGMQPCHPDFTP